MSYKRGHWCPAIRDTCKGDICVCYRLLNFGEPYCHNYKVHLQPERQVEPKKKEDTDV